MKTLSQKKPAISIIIPMYNLEKYIEECLLSVLIQTFQDFEVIVVDDCSTDNSVSIVESLTPKFNGKLKLIKLKKNSGNAGEPRNVGLSHSSGKYVFFLDGDDLITHTALEELYSYTNDESIDIIHSDNNFVPFKFNSSSNEYMSTEEIDDNTVFRMVTSEKHTNPLFETDDLSERMTRFVQRRFWSTVWRNLYSRKFIEDNGINFSDALLLEDDLFTFQCLCCAKKILNIPNVFYIYRMRKTSLSHNSSSHKHDQKIDTMMKLFNLLDKFMTGKELFVDKPEVKYMVFTFFAKKLTGTLTQVEPYELDSLLRRKLSEDLEGNLALMAYSFNMMNFYHYHYIESEKKCEKLKING